MPEIAGKPCLSSSIEMGYAADEHKANVLSCEAVPLRACSVSFKGASGIRHTVEVESETLYEAAVMAVARFRQDIWGEAIALGTTLEVEVREPATKHSLTLQQVERWLAQPGAPYEASKKAKLKMLLVKG
jgi:hypothetical protein